MLKLLIISRPTYFSPLYIFHKRLLTLPYIAYVMLDLDSFHVRLGNI